MYLSFKVELSSNDLQDIFFLVLKSTQMQKNPFRRAFRASGFPFQSFRNKRQLSVISIWQSKWFNKYLIENPKLSIKTSEILLVM